MLSILGLTNIKLVAYGAIAAILAAILIYCYILRKDNAQLASDLAKSTIVLGQQSQVLLACDKNTKDLKAKEDKNTTDARVAVEEAKKQAVEDYKRTIDLAHRKPKDPVITKDNSKNYGGTNTSEQVKDYLSSHDLINEEIDIRAKEKMARGNK